MKYKNNFAKAAKSQQDTNIGRVLFNFINGGGVIFTVETVFVHQQFCRSYPTNNQRRFFSLSTTFLGGWRGYKKFAPKKGCIHNKDFLQGRMIICLSSWSNRPWGGGATPPVPGNSACRYKQNSALEYKWNKIYIYIFKTSKDNMQNNFHTTELTAVKLISTLKENEIQ